MTATLLDMGFSPLGITDKSFKMLGVMEALRAGMTLEQVAQHGWWRTTEMPLHYKHNSMDYKADLASKIPFEERQDVSSKKHCPLCLSGSLQKLSGPCLSCLRFTFSLHALPILIK
jgi:hypothetical protein